MSVCRERAMAFSRFLLITMLKDRLVVFTKKLKGEVREGSR
jgi:hypothetical protein